MAKKETREQVGVVRFTYVDEEEGKKVARIPYFEGEDPAEVEAKERKKLGR